MTSTEFVQKAKKYAKNYKTTYVWGTFGWPTTSAMITRALNAYSSNSKYSTKLNNYKNQGYIMADCVGMIKSILWGFTGNTSSNYCGATYASNGCPDIDADTMINRCSGVSTNFSNIVPGEVVWMTGHIGIYVGDGLVVECTPAWDDGVQTTTLGNVGTKTGYHSRTWTKHGKLPYVQYVQSTTQTQTSAAFASNVAKVKSRFGFEDKTIAWLKTYQWAEALFDKLANSK